MKIQKGSTFYIDADQFDLSQIRVGLGWDMRKKAQLGLLRKIKGEKKPKDFDLDLLAFLLDEKGKLRNLGHTKEMKRGFKVPLFGSDIIHFNNLKLPDETVIHSGDNPNGEGPGDDEQLIIHLDKLAPRYHQILFFVIIFEAQERKQHFGMVENAFIRALDANQEEILQFDLSNDDSYTDKCSMLFARIFRHGDGWDFEAIGQGYKTDSFVDLMRQYVDFES